MRILLDTNVVLDYVLERSHFYAGAKEIWEAVGTGAVTGFVTASSITDIFYLARKAFGAEKALEAVHLCLEVFEICTVDRHALELAVTLPGNDFEDNLQAACASVVGLDIIITRDKEAFKSGTIPALAPEEALAQLQI
jgi:predicted nucleic acid-binding protein